MFHTQNEHGVESEITPKKTPSPSISGHGNPSSQRSSSDLDKSHNHKKVKHRLTSSDDYTSYHPKSPNVLEEITANSSRTNVSNGGCGGSSDSSIILIHPNTSRSCETFDIDSSSCSVKTRELFSEIPVINQTSPLTIKSTNHHHLVVNSHVSAPAVTEAYYLEPILEDEKSSDRSVTKSDSNISYNVCPIMPFPNNKNPVKTKEPQKDTIEDDNVSSPLREKDKVERVRMASSSSTMIFCDPNEDDVITNNKDTNMYMSHQQQQQQHSPSKSRRNSISSLFSSKSDKSKGGISMNQSLEDKNVLVDTLGTTPNSLYGTLRIEEQCVEGEMRNDDSHMSSSKRTSDFEFDRPSLESTLTKDAVYHRKGYSGAMMKFKLTGEDEHILDRSQLHSRSGMSSERTRSRGTINFCDHEEVFKLFK